MPRLSSQNKKLLRKLENAYVVCNDCGSKYGVYSVGCSSVWEGDCDVCGESKPVTEARDYAYLITGIRKVTRGENLD
jgi:translation initiation factor 2 beta subunit (eIF-2beta)/eIF-5